MNRNIALYVVLCIVTLGIFVFYWAYKLNEEIAREEANKNKIHKYEDSADYGFELFWEYDQ